MSMGMGMALRRAMVIPVITSLAIASQASLAAKRVTITCYHNGGPAELFNRAFQGAANAFEKLHPDIKVKIVGGSDMSKMLAAMAGGLAPDCAMLDEKITSYAARSIVKPLDQYLKQSRIDETDFWAPSWREDVWQGKVWAMPWGTDANFGLFMNKERFREVGLPPVSPKTVQELDAISPKLTKRNDAGRLTAISIVPWSAYGGMNSVYTWGWVFGGDFYDPATKKVTSNDPKIAKALNWMKTFAAANGGYSKIAFNWSPSQKACDFFKGNMALGIYHGQELPWIAKNAPNIDMSINPMPVDEGVTKSPTWVGGWKIGMLNSTRNPQATWEWIRFITADKEGTSVLNEPLGWFPSYRGSNLYNTYKKDPKTAPFMKILETASHQRPVMPASEVYGAQLEVVFGQVFSDRITPAQALERCREAVQRELDRLLARYKIK